MTERQDTTVTLEETAVQDLTSRLRGTLLRPGDAGYEETRPVYNAMIDKSPALIARCVDIADVIAAVNFAREQKLTLAVRGGCDRHETRLRRRRQRGRSLPPRGVRGATSSVIASAQG